MGILKKTFVAIFMMMMITPLLFMDLTSDRASVNENRMLANPPLLVHLKSRPGTFIMKFNSWFEDSTGFREQLVSLYNAVEKNNWLRGSMYNNGLFLYLVGKEGHQYFADVGARLASKFQGKQFISDNMLANMAAGLEEVKMYLESRNVPFIVMLCADKESIYPEFYPKQIKRGPEPIQLDIITDYIKTHTSVDVFNIKNALLSEKDNYMLYGIFGNHDALSHYNEIGAFFSYRELMRHINIHFPDIVPFELGDIDITFRKNGEHRVSLKQPQNYRRLNRSMFDTLNFALDNSFFGRGLFNEAYESDNADRPVILFLRTSYSNENYTGKYFARQFQKAIMIHFYNMEFIEEYVTAFKPDIVVFESSEYQLEMFAECASKIPPLR